MEWKIMRASDIFKEEKAYMANIDTIQDLEELSQKYHQRLIIDFVEKEIIIYDYYVE